MTHHWDEFSKSLAEPLPRRDSLRRLGLVIASAVLSPLGMATASAKGPQVKDPCDTFCRCRRKSDQSRCLDDCRLCLADGGQPHGKCGAYFCCYAGDTLCGNYCADLAADGNNCGACGYECAPPGPWEHGACIDGRCEYWCTDNAVDCNGVCTMLELDGNNCGACGHVCPEEAPYCAWGVCKECPGFQTMCNGECVDLNTDFLNCGACGYACPAGYSYCDGGVCQSGGGSWDPGPAP